MTQKHIATRERKELVARCAGLGLREADIASLLHISDKTLRARYAPELQGGHAEATQRVASRLFDLVMQDDDRKIAMTSAIFWMKCRAQWREGDSAAVNVTATANAQTSSAVIVSPGLLDADAWNELARQHQQAMPRFEAATTPTSSAAPRDGAQERLRRAEERWRVVQGELQPKSKRIPRRAEREPGGVLG